MRSPSIARGLCAASRRQARLAGGVVGEFDGLVVSLALVPRFDLNLAFVEREPADPRQAIERAAAFCRDHGLDLTLDLESGGSPAVIQAASAAGFGPGVSRPAMSLRLGGFSPQALPDGLSVRRAVTEGDLRALVAVEAEGFGFTEDVAERLFLPAMLLDPGLRAYVAFLEQDPIAAALVHLDHRAAGIYWVATVPAMRRRGIGAAVLGRALAEGAPDAEFAWLQSSRLGRPVYERLGFRVAGEWTVWQGNGSR
jgi:GNAT superfamily N-acetyltransferase